MSPPATFLTDLERGTRDPVDRTIIRELMQNGRVGTTALARTAGVSEATARRRVQSLLAEGAISLRVVVDPALFGLRAEAMLFIKTQRNRIEPLVRGMLEMPYVRYAAGTAGEYQVVANIAAPDESVLYDYITTAPWVADAAALETNMVVQAVKRSGRQCDGFRHLAAPPARLIAISDRLVADFAEPRPAVECCDPHHACFLYSPDGRRNSMQRDAILGAIEDSPQRRWLLLAPVAPVLALVTAVWLPFVNTADLWLGMPRLLVWCSAWVLLLLPALAAVEFGLVRPHEERSDDRQLEEATL